MTRYIFDSVYVDFRCLIQNCSYGHANIEVYSHIRIIWTQIIRLKFLTSSIENDKIDWNKWLSRNSIDALRNFWTIFEQNLIHTNRAWIVMTSDVREGKKKQGKGVKHIISYPLSMVTIPILTMNAHQGHPVKPLAF